VNPFSERLLGVTMNDDLSWNTHLENVINNVFLIMITMIERSSIWKL